MDGDKPVCFYRESILKFTNLLTDQKVPAEHGPWHWLQFEPDLALGNVTNPMMAGMFSMRLYVNDLTKDGPFDIKEIPEWKQKPPKRNDPYRMRAAIYQCEGLPPADEEGNSDPFVEVWTGQDQRVVTQVCNDTNNPIYY